MQTEADIASFLGTQSAIVYAHAFSTITSVIPCFCKRGDVIVADKMVNYSIRKGLEASRSSIRWYDHNDMADMERVMKKVAEEQAKKRILTRRFVVTEGLFEMIGDCSDLPKLVGSPSSPRFFRVPCATYHSYHADNGSRSSSRKSTNSVLLSTRPIHLVFSAAMAVD